jgi:hypothetical protein
LGQIHFSWLQKGSHPHSRGGKKLFSEYRNEVACHARPKTKKLFLKFFLKILNKALYDSMRLLECKNAKLILGYCHPCLSTLWPFDTNTLKRCFGNSSARSDKRKPRHEDGVFFLLGSSSELERSTQSAPETNKSIFLFQSNRRKLSYRYPRTNLNSNPGNSVCRDLAEFRQQHP